MAELHDRLEAAAARPGRDTPLAQVEQRLRARRRTRIGGAVVASLLCLSLVGGGVALATDGARDGRVSTNRPASQVASTATLSIGLPEGWVWSPLDTAVTDTELLRVGTRLLPPDEPLVQETELCTLLDGSADAFVIVGEYGSPDADSDSWMVRPADFATAAPASEVECGTTFTDGSPVPGSGHVARYFFDEGPQLYLAIVAVGPLDSSTNLADAYAALNSLVVDPPPPPPSVITIPPTVPPSTVPASPDEQAVRDVFLAWIDTQPRDAIGPYVEDWESIKDAVMQAAATAPLPLDGYTGRVEAVLAIADTKADVIYSFLNGGAVAVGNLRGQAVKIDGVWKVSRETVCAAIEIGGVKCPPRTG